jgi:hypothetical protein
MQGSPDFQCGGLDFAAAIETGCEFRDTLRVEIESEYLEVSAEGHGQGKTDITEPDDSHLELFERGEGGKRRHAVSSGD